MSQEKQVNIILSGKAWYKNCFLFLVAFEVVLIFLDVFVNYFRWASVGAIRRMVNITREDSIGTWFSSSQMILVGVVLFLIALALKKQNSVKQVKWRYRGWLLIATFFTYMGIDDAIKFHERIGTAFKSLSNSGLTNNPGFIDSLWSMFPSYAWQFVFGDISFLVESLKPLS